jgi:uncharacterized protein (DUF488 family)
MPVPLTSPDRSTPAPATPGVAAVTIGVYGSSLEAFLRRLREHHVSLVIDVRQRRGVRGPEYSWANSQRLQAALAGAGVSYLHRKDLAPTTQLRHLQYREDAQSGVGKRSRVELAPAYIRGYQEEILASADLDLLVRQLRDAERAALLCVEKDAPACHRSLVAARLERDYGVRFSHV